MASQNHNGVEDGFEWVATGVPIEQTQWPPIAPTVKNRTAVIWNQALLPGDEWYAQNLWLTKVSTGWKLSGSYGQSRNNRIFYPRNLSQLPITIEGQMPNQYQYDRLVYFVKTSHQMALNQGKGSEQQALTFALPPAMLGLKGHRNVLDLKKEDGRGYRADAAWDGNKIVRRYYREIYVDGYILGIKAGHPRWNFAPKFTMDLLVSWDHIDEEVQLAAQLGNLIKRPATQVQENAPLFQNYQFQLRIDKSQLNKAEETDLVPLTNTPLSAIQNIGITNWYNP